MKENKPLLGLCPIGKFVFSNEDAIRHKKLIQNKLCELNVPYCDLDDLIEDGLVKNQNQVDCVVEYFKDKKIDALFIPHCNFGTEGAAAAIAKKLSVPTLLWGPEDKLPLKDGTRLRDTLCGLFATSKVLNKLGVKFTYIENCDIDQSCFTDGLNKFLRAANVAKVFRNGIKVGHIGQRIDFFWSTIINESELLTDFNVEILPIDMVDFIKASKARAKNKKNKYQQEIDVLKRDIAIESLDDNILAVILAVRDQMLDTADEYDLDGFAVQDFMALVNEVGAYCFFANSMVSDQYPIGCESDIHGVISNIILQKVSFDTQSTFLVDLTNKHPNLEDVVLLWHAGAPLSMKDANEKVTLGKHWILPSDLSGMTHFKLKDGDVTVARFDGETGNYKLGIGQGSSTEGPYTLNNYLWLKVQDWASWEKKIINGPFIHHVGMVYGHYQDALVEACRYVDNLEAVLLNE